MVGNATTLYRFLFDKHDSLEILGLFEWNDFNYKLLFPRHAYDLHKNGVLQLKDL